MQKINSKETPTCLEATTQFPDFYTKNYLEKKSEEYLNIEAGGVLAGGWDGGGNVSSRGWAPEEVAGPVIHKHPGWQQRHSTFFPSFTG